MNEIPSDIAIEHTILSSCMQRQECVDYSCERLNEYDFYDTRCRIIFRAIKGLNKENVTPDILTVIDWIKRNKLASTCRDDSVAAVYGKASVGEAKIKDLIEIVREKSSLRSIIRFSEIAISESMALEKSDSIISNIERGIIKCTDRPEDGAFQRLGDSLSKTFEENTKRSQGQIKGIPTGIGELDSFLGGLEPGDVTVLGGRPSQGKTALATGIILHAAQLGHKCALFTMEMSKKQMTNRFLCSVARQNVHALMHGFLKHDGHIEIQKAAGIIDGLPIYMDDTSGVTPGYVKSKTRGMKRRDGVELVIIDYLQLMHTEKECRSEYDKITAISPEIKRIAKDLDVHVLALSQLSRLNKSDKTGKRKENHRPNMSDLRQSGQIEQDADNVILIHREEKYNPQPDNLGMAEIIVDKQRNGPTGIANCRFEAKCARFHDEIDNGF